MSGETNQNKINIIFQFLQPVRFATQGSRVVSLSKKMSSKCKLRTAPRAGSSQNKEIRNTKCQNVCHTVGQLWHSKENKQILSSFSSCFRSWTKHFYANHPEDLDSDTDTEAAVREHFGQGDPIQIGFGQLPLILNDYKEYQGDS